MRVLFAGGGTGGHIYPALAMAKAVQELEPGSTVEFVGTPIGLESKLVPQAGFVIHYISVGKLHSSVGLLQRLKTLVQLPFAILKAVSLIVRFRPDVVVGVGGYASGPAVLAAALMGRATLIWEPNAHPGLANRWLSRVVRQTLVVFAEAARLMGGSKILQVPMPVRKEIDSGVASRAGDGQFHILVFGGSQGARAINNAVLEAVRRGGAWLAGTRIVHQVGATDFARMKAAYAELPAATQEHVSVHEYLHDMPERYAWADVIVARSGTGTLSELAACGRAAILVPLPTAADDHQTKNAQALEVKGAAILLPQKELTPERLIQEVENLKKDPVLRERIEKNIRAFHQPRAVYEIAKLIFESGRK